MKLNELQPNEGSFKGKMRVGRGIGSGKGKTSGRGVKGQKARKGVAIKGFEGGQMPLYFRLPKRGFNNIFAKDLVELTLVRLQYAIDMKQIDTANVIDEDALVASGVVRRKRDGIKLIASGELTSKVNLQLSATTTGAEEAVKKAGGSIVIVKKEVKLFGKAAEGKGKKQLKNA
jgi:large subunit ribosomal protein L15